MTLPPKSRIILPSKKVIAPWRRPIRRRGSQVAFPIQSATLRTTDDTPTVFFSYTPTDSSIFRFQLTCLIGRIASGANTNKAGRFVVAATGSAVCIRRDGAALSAIAAFTTTLTKSAGGDAATFTGTAAQSLAAAPVYQIVVTGIAGTDIDWYGSYWLDEIGV